MIDSTTTIQIVRALNIFTNKTIAANYTTSLDDTYSSLTTSDNNIDHRVANDNGSTYDDVSLIGNILRYALHVVYLFLGGIAILIVLVLIVYIFLYICDRCCCCSPWFGPMTANVIGLNNDNDDDSNILNEITIGPIARKAGLWGLTYDERQSILQHIFQRKAYKEHEIHKKGKEDDDTYNPESEEDTDIETGLIEETNHKDTSKQIEDERLKQQNVDPVECHNDDVDVENVKIENDKDGNDQSSSDIITKKDALHATTCAICLLDYEEGESVLKVNQCSHVFHFECAMEWFQDHDDCPYCRKEIMTAITMRKGALEVLGQERYKQVCPWAVVTKNNNEVGTTAAILTQDPPQQFTLLSLSPLSSSSNHNGLNNNFSNREIDRDSSQLTDTDISADSPTDTLSDTSSQPRENVLTEIESTTSFPSSIESKNSEI